MVVTYIDKSISEDDLQESPGVILGYRYDEDDNERVIVYIGKDPTDTVVASKSDMVAIANPKIDGGVYWGKFRTNFFSGMTSNDVLKLKYKEYNKEIANVKRMLTIKKKKDANKSGK